MGEELSTTAKEEAEGFLLFSRLLEERGFQLSRGKYEHGNGDTLPTVVIARPDTPEWCGVWMPWESQGEFEGDVFGEDQAILELTGKAIAKWDEEAHGFVDSE